MRYYYCLNCGHLHDYGFDRKKSLECKRCKTKEHLIESDKKEYDDAHPSRKQLNHSTSI